jgi:hypothetical protein
MSGTWNTSSDDMQCDMDDKSWEGANTALGLIKHTISAAIMQQLHP